MSRDVQTVSDATDCDDPPETGLHVRELGDANIAGTEGGNYKGSRPGVLLKDFVLFPLLHPAAALHQGSMLEPLREDFKKLRAFLYRHSQPAPAEATTPTAPVLNIEPPQPTQMDLFGNSWAACSSEGLRDSLAAAWLCNSFRSGLHPNGTSNSARHRLRRPQRQAMQPLASRSQPSYPHLPQRTRTSPTSNAEAARRMRERDEDRRDSPALTRFDNPSPQEPGSTPHQQVTRNSAVSPGWKKCLG